MKGGIAVARSLIPGALRAGDKTMEETFMKFSKSAGGFVGLFSMFGAYQRWCRTTSTRAQYFEKMLDMCGLIDDPDCPKAGKHRELERAEIKKSQYAVQRTVSAVRNFTNPFSIPDKDHLYSLASGAPKLPARKSRKANEEGLSDGSNIQLALKLKLFMKGNLD
ncbi:PREDICTED: uncharacterized protein LOC107346954 [Acropora digitifera]|uniref:uncharacterized protein LOC107346954 n=1 Tax=Acropora digitifera TaxID=70779 RepID=UPI00077A6068|nr:PREDICTED: uncharacterized protein LOC107346954 [Acropora digitifera]